MALTLYLSGTSSGETAINSGVDIFSDRINTATGTPASNSFSVSSSSSAIGTHRISSSSVINSHTGATPTGNWSVEIDITAGNSSCEVRVHLYRIQGSVAQTTVTSSFQTATAGLKTFSFTDPALGTWTSGNRIAVGVEVRNNATMGGAITITYETDTTDAEFVTQFGVADQTVVANFLSASTSVFTPNVTYAQTVVANLIGTGLTILTPTVTFAQTVVPDFISVGTILFSPAIPIVYPNLIATNVQVFDPTVTLQGLIVVPTLIDGVNVFQPSVSGGVADLARSFAVVVM